MLNRTSLAILAALAAPVGVLACKGESMTVGAAPEPDAGAPSLRPATIQAGDEWSGYIESFRFASGSDKVTLAFTSQTTGTIAFGEPTTQTPDPTGAYATWVKEVSSSDYFDQLRRPEQALRTVTARTYEHFRFSLQSGTYDGARLSFRIGLNEAWGVWCAGRRPDVYCKSPPCGCGSFTDPTYQQVWPLCESEESLPAVFRICRCSADHCEADVAYTIEEAAHVESMFPRLDLRQLHFDFRMVGPTLRGTTEIGEIFLERRGGS